MLSKTYKTEFDENVITLAEQNGRPLEIEDEINLTLVIRNGNTKRLFVWKHGLQFTDFLYWLEISWVARATLHQFFSKKQAQVNFDAVRTIIDCFIC